ncbi:Capsular biosynthesis protein [Vibrio crassostreae]|uniref:glycosyltransferase family 2 protein n=1 Tax=Vibrio crassostreae TaxID=246167 RepID=UPI001B30ED2D|nr:glycosyltransferase family 2 protein [Vibrio crassostreae]CAK2025102.1 Capsular biosynthesis protein [Vibrio crassostreae]CAK2027032.1 Capsular biosynthesis protein [Vibrio crassostreae]CAK2028881.1 Capsular biosynthesis protein [Vibrio crassostreae]CAK2029939.1 Capsular biosynthesis protein [Vibrio crassostreae]CAK2035145.1 Capsular biosynthesis protein [Vibrio crassostreae]
MIIIPMAGLSSRFFQAGYTKPKYMLEAHGKTLFNHAVSSFEQYFDSEEFLFIVRDVYGTPDFVRQQAEMLGIKEYKVSILECETKGQAETVVLGLEDVCYKGSITIFNIDTFRPGFKYPSLEEMGNGYLEVFKGDGDNWSFAKPLNNGTTKVIETAEKNPISNLCCTGLYYFSDVESFFESYREYLNLPKEKWQKGELYVAPLYNHLISQGLDIRYKLIERNEVIFCGVPDEYDEFLKN